MIMVAVVIPFTMFYYEADSETCVLYRSCLAVLCLMALDVEAALASSVA